MIVEPEEVKKLRLETKNTIDVAQFVDPEDLPPYLFENPYFVVPDPKGSAEAFAVVRAAMVQADKVAIGEVAFAGREHLVAIAPASRQERPRPHGLHPALRRRTARRQRLLRGIPEHTIDKKQLALANDLIRAHSAPFHLDDFKDDYEAALRELIEAKRKRSRCPSPKRNRAPRSSTSWTP